MPTWQYGPPARAAPRRSSAREGLRAECARSRRGRARSIAPLARTGVEGKERPAQPGTAKDGDGGGHLVPLHERGGEQHDDRLARDAHKLEVELHARRKHEPDRRRVHADQQAAHPQPRAQPLPEGHERVDEHDARREEACAGASEPRR